MFVLFGEERVTKIIRRREFDCPVCRRSRPARRLAETSYLSVFMIPLLPLRRRSDYWECSGCGNAFASEGAQAPSANPVIRRVLVYVMLGYGASVHRETLRQIFVRVTGAPIADAEIEKESRSIASGGMGEIIAFLKRSAYCLNPRGKEQVVEAAFLMTHASCEIQQQDRVRVNIIGGVLGLPSEQVEAVVERVRAARYYGVRRNLITS